MVSYKRLFHSGTFWIFQHKGTVAYNIIVFFIFDENIILKMFGSIDVKIPPDFCS